MPSLTYVAPTTAEEAVRALAGVVGVGKPLSGGTDLLRVACTSTAGPNSGYEPADIRRVANKVFDPNNRTTGYIVSSTKPAGGAK